MMAFFNFIIMNKDEQIKKSKQIVDFLNDRELISVKILEDKLNLPGATISKAIYGTRLIPKKHIQRIECVLEKYGYLG